MIRVLHVVWKMDRAGLESRLMDIYRNIDRTKIQFDFYTCTTEKGEFDDEILSLGGRIYYSKQSSWFSMPKKIKIFLTDHHEYQIVHCHLDYLCGLILLGAKWADVPTRIAQAHSAVTEKSVKNSIRNIVKHLTNYSATHRFAVSKKAGNYLFGASDVENGSVKILPALIDHRAFMLPDEVRSKARGKLGLGDSFTIVHTASFKPVKNHPFLLEVFKELQLLDSNSRLILIGDDVSNGAIPRLAKELEVYDKVLFLGIRRDVNILLQAGDVFVFPSLFEGLPGAVLEAQAAGLPCFISDTITDEVCITPLSTQLSLSNSPKEWASAIYSTKERPQIDTEMYFERAGFVLSKQVESLTLFYENCVKKSKGVQSVEIIHGK